MRHHLLRKLRNIMEEEKGCGIVVSTEASLFYFTGFKGLGYLVYRADDDSFTLLVPTLEYLRARKTIAEEALESYIDVVAFTPYGLPNGLVLDSAEFKLMTGKASEIISSMLPRGCRLLLETDSVTLLKKLKKAFTVEDISDNIADVRAIKEPWEIERIEAAVEIAEAALNAAISSLDFGVSEAEIAAIIEYEMRRRGALDHAFPTIVAFGENTVYPHAEPSSRRILNYRPQPVLIDLGAVYKGYCSDMTRTIMDDADTEFRAVAEAVHEAVYTAVDVIRPGVTAHEVYEAARRVLASKGFGKYFIHSLGHGVGIEVHEKPRISYKDNTELQEGMVITIEPGVYIPGKYGVRIEELVLVTRSGARLLTKFPSTLW